MSITVRRRVKKSPGLPEEITNDARLWVDPTGVEEVQFATNLDRLRHSHFDAIIFTDSLKKLAQAMMKTDSEEAIKAFGVAMQAGIQPTPKL